MGLGHRMSFEDEYLGGIPAEWHDEPTEVTAKPPTETERLSLLQEAVDLVYSDIRLNRFSLLSDKAVEAVRTAYIAGHQKS